MNPAIYSNAVRLNTTAWSQVQTSEIENVSYMILEENKKKFTFFHKRQTQDNNGLIKYGCVSVE